MQRISNPALATNIDNLNNYAPQILTDMLRRTINKILQYPLAMSFTLTSIEGPG